MPADYYSALGVDRGASTDDIKKAFRRLAMQYHPDRNHEPGAEARFKEVNEAYEVLSDPDKRSAYDRFGHAGLGGNGGAAGFEGFDFGGFGDIFDTFFGGSMRRKQRGPQRGADARATLTLEFEEAVFGCEKEVELARHETCSTCGGEGAAPGTKRERCTTCGGSGELRRTQSTLFGQFVNVAPCDRCHGEGTITPNPCPTCRGTGREKKSRKLVVKVPAGVDNGAQLRLTGEGEVGARGGPAGNLYVVLHVRPHEVFARDDDNIILDLPVNIAQAALGAELQIPTLDGEQAFTVPAGTQNDRVFTIRGKGVPHLRQQGRGDMHVRVRVQVPTGLTDDQRRLLKEFGDSLGTPTGVNHEDKGLFGRIKDAFAS